MGTCLQNFKGWHIAYLVSWFGFQRRDDASTGQINAFPVRPEGPCSQEERGNYVSCAYIKRTRRINSSDGMVSSIWRWFVLDEFFHLF